MNAIFFMEFKGFTAMATGLARDAGSIALTAERVRASGITIVDSVLRQASLSASPVKSEHLGGDTWALVFGSLEDAITFGCAVLRGFQKLATQNAVFFLKPSIAIGIGDPKWKDGRPLDDISVATYTVADKGMPYDVILVGEAIPSSLQYNWIIQGAEARIADIELPLKKVDWQTSLPPKLLQTPDISVSIPPLLLDSDIIFSPTTRDAIGQLAYQQAAAHEVLAFGGPVPYDIVEYRSYLREAVLLLRSNRGFRLSTLTYIPRSEARYGYAWLELARRVRVECPSCFAPAAFVLPEDQLRPLSYHIYDEDIVHLGLRSFVPQRGVETMSASFLFRNRSIADRFRAEFNSNWRRIGVLDDQALSRLLQELPPLSAADKKEAMTAVHDILAP